MLSNSKKNWLNDFNGLLKFFCFKYVLIKLNAIFFKRISFTRKYIKKCFKFLFFLLQISD